MDTNNFTHWRPNSSVVKFFQQIKERKISRPIGNSIEITNSSPPESDGFSTPVEEYTSLQKERERNRNSARGKKRPAEPRYSVSISPPQQRKRPKSGKTSLERDLQQAYF